MEIFLQVYFLNLRLSCLRKHNLLLTITQFTATGNVDDAKGDRVICMRSNFLCHKQIRLNLFRCSTDFILRLRLTFSGFNFFKKTIYTHPPQRALVTLFYPLHWIMICVHQLRTLGFPTVENGGG